MLYNSNTERKKGVLCVSWTEKDAIHSVWMNLWNEQTKKEEMQKQTPSINRRKKKKQRKNTKKKRENHL